MEKEKLTKVKQHLERLCLNLPDSEWTSGCVKLIFPPTINAGYKTQPRFFDKSGNKLRLIPEYDEAFEKDLFELVVLANQESEVNEILFEVSREPVLASTIQTNFSQEVVDRFNENLPKSQQGKTTAWYKRTKV